MIRHDAQEAAIRVDLPALSTTMDDGLGQSDFCEMGGAAI